MYNDQRGVCTLCGLHIEEGNAVLDHDHETGYVRSVLHRQCNQAEGRILSWIRRTGKTNDPLAFIKRTVLYWEQDHSHNPVHPTHRTETEHKILVLKRKVRKLKTAKGKAKYLKQIKELQHGEV